MDAAIIRPVLVKNRETSLPWSARRAMASAGTGLRGLRVLFISRRYNSYTALVQILGRGFTRINADWKPHHPSSRVAPGKLHRSFASLRMAMWEGVVVWTHARGRARLHSTGGAFSWGAELVPGFAVRAVDPLSSVVVFRAEEQAGAGLD